MAKERLYLTDITLHTRDFRPTAQYSKIAEKGRMYFPMNPKTTPQAKDTSAIKDANEKEHTFQLVIQWPADLQARINSGEVEVMIPEGGLYIFPGQDAIELAKAMAKKEHRANIHKKFGKKAWRDNQKGV